LLPTSGVCKNRFKSIPELRQLDPNHPSKELVSDREADVSKLTSDRNDFGDLRLYRFSIMEGKSEKMLAKVIIALVANFEKIPYLFQSFCVKDMILRSTVEHKEKLDLGLFVALAPFKIGLRVSDRIRS